MVTVSVRFAKLPRQLIRHVSYWSGFPDATDSPIYFVGIYAAVSFLFHYQIAVSRFDNLPLDNSSWYGLFILHIAKMTFDMV